MDQLKQFFKNFSDFISRMTPSQVMMLFGVVAGTIVGAFLVVGWINEVRFAQLYSGMDQNDAGEIISYLDDHKIPYKLSNNGTTIEVPSDDVYRTRISLASDGLPHGGSVGYSIFDRNNLGMTDFIQNLNFRRALEGELTRTITQLNEVKAARVHIVMPKEHLFKQDKQEATASVVLKLTGSDRLSKRQVNGIAHLVSSSVEGLRPANVVILDYDGNLLTSGQQSDQLAGLSSTQLEVRKSVEQYLEQKSQTMLDDVLGNSKSVVRVTADLNFQQLERTSETFDPSSPSIRSEERTKSTDISSDKAQETSESTEEGNSEYSITNYELNKTVEHIINAVGSVERLSVAVVLDGSYEELENEAGEIERIYQPRTQEELDRLAGIVKNAVGFDQQRNDQMEIINIPFDRRNLDSDREMLDSMYQREFYVDIAKKVGLVLLALFGFMYLKKRSKSLFAALGRIAPPPRPRVEPQNVEPIAREEEPRVEPIVAERRKPKLVDQMQVTAKENPEEIAKVIKTIMIE